MGGLEQLLPFVLIALVFWLLLIRPQRKRQLELARTQGGIGIGDEVLLGAGIAGRVASTDEEFLLLEISPGVTMKVARQAVVRVLDAQPRPDDVPLDDRIDDGYERFDESADGWDESDGRDEPGRPGAPGSPA